MVYTKEQLIEFAVQALELRRQAHILEIEQTKLIENAPAAEGDRHRMLGAQIRALRAKAAEIYAPVLAAMEAERR